MQYKVGVIGRFGAKEILCDGQTVKTKNLSELLEKSGCATVAKADTYYFRKNNFKLLFDTLKCMLTCDHIFLMVSVNGMNFYLPFLYYVNKLTKRNIYHYVIGSELLKMVEDDPKLVTYLNALDINWFEYESGTRFLRDRGVENASTLPNFKLLTPVLDASAYVDENEIFRFCTFSRVIEEKGITDAICTVRELNAERGRVDVTLDVYGPVEAGYAETFWRLVKENQDFIQYKGVADSSRSVEILKDYYALLFPTRWAGEGTPGTVIDAFAAGVPVIASDWNANRELISHRKQGLLYPEEGMQTLTDAVRWAIQNPGQMNRMRAESRAAFDDFSPEMVLKTILSEMERREAKRRR